MTKEATVRVMPLRKDSKKPGEFPGKWNGETKADS